MKKLPLFLRRRFEGFEIIDFKEWITDRRIEVHLAKSKQRACCHRCKTVLTDTNRSKHLLKLEDMPVMGIRSFVYIWRRKGFCSKCKRYCSEYLPFVCKESPHLTLEYGWWLGRLCEIASISNVATLTEQEAMTLWRHDFKRLQRLLQKYEVPPLTHISVDEVYARKKLPEDLGDEDKNKSSKYFTVVSDLKTRKVVWISLGRSKEALDTFYILLGEQRCKQIEVVAMDQFDGFAASTRDYCPRATIVWDKFHIMKQFEEAINEVRKNLHEAAYKNSDTKRLSRGQFRFTFLKIASRRTVGEKEHIDSIINANKDFNQLELIKEHMLSFFYQPTIDAAMELWTTLGAWIFRLHDAFKPLMRWYSNLEHGWNTLINYFKFPVTTSLSEGINNVIKMLKRKAFGYRNMDYFRLKIMQKCGFLNSNFIPTDS